MVFACHAISHSLWGYIVMYGTTAKTAMNTSQGIMDGNLDESLFGGILGTFPLPTDSSARHPCDE